MTGNGLMDIVYTTGDFNSEDGVRSRVKVLVQDSSGDFAEPARNSPCILIRIKHFIALRK